MPRAVFLFFLLFVITPCTWAADGRADYDLDDDGLIEIDDWSDLNEVRFNLDGSALYGSSAGCPVDGCIGFELTTDLDFDTNANGVLDVGDTFWNEGEGWQPIGDYSDPFTAVFHGNGHEIQNLMIARPNAELQGLFGYIDYATVRGLGLTGPLMTIEGDVDVGGLAASINQSQIIACYVKGSVSGRAYIGGLTGFLDDSQMIATFFTGTVTGAEDKIGGIAGFVRYSEVTASYVTGAVIGRDEVGGLVGYLSSSNVTASLSTANVSGVSYIGGLIGAGSGGSTNFSHWAVDASEQRSSAGGVGVALVELFCPIGADNNTCAEVNLFESWSNYTDEEDFPYWDFGTESELPGLRLLGSVYRDGDGDGVEQAYDAFPTQFAGSVDSDGDGAIDYWTPGCDAICRMASGLVLDQFPSISAAAVDADWDGLPDEWSADCDSVCQSTSGLTLDTFPNDTDNDGLTNQNDEDDNNDGITDADANSNGLIDVGTIVELDAIRFSLAGEGQRSSADSELDTSGCPQIVVNGTLKERCVGYELTADLDFDSNGDGVFDSSDAYWNGGEGWEPIGSSSDNAFSGLLHGNGHRIINLVVARPGTNFQGLFGYLDNAVVRELGLIGPLMAIEGNEYVGGLAGYTSYSQVTAAYISGSVTGTGAYVGGLVGHSNYTEIAASYTTGTVVGDFGVGGVIGKTNHSQVVAIMTTAQVSARSGGGLIGSGDYGSSVSVSYWAEDVSGRPFNSSGATGVTLVELKCPTAADDTECAIDTLYQDWSSYQDAEGNAYWDFGSDTELPGLRLNGRVYRDADGDGVATEFDAFPWQFAASVDSDGDGAPDIWKDGCEAECHAASGLILDLFPADAAASIDTDEDGLPDQWNESCDSACQSYSGLTLDDDNDNDGVVNTEDAFPINAAAAVDTDGDGLPDAWLNTCDSACQSTSGLTLDASLDDTDNDGVVNDEDAFVNNSAASVDTDGDGLPDAWRLGCYGTCQSGSGLTLDDDNDNDGVANSEDAFPVHAAASVDNDGDGLPDAWLDACDSACQSASGLTLDTSLNDTDNDGAANSEDAFRFNAAASVDTDRDGRPDAWHDDCDSACQTSSRLTLDDDNDDDGIANSEDAFPIHAAASVDDDGDGLPDAWLDACDSACQVASGLTLDTSLNDTDNDGVANNEDAYLTDPDRSVDADAPEMVKVPQAISLAATGESTLVTLNVLEAQAYDSFDNELEYQVELNGELLVRNPDQQVSLPSGALMLQWFAVDDAGNRSEPMAQTVKVYPQVRFTEAESITGEQRQALVAVGLSGPSPEYPISVMVRWVESESDVTAADFIVEGDSGVDLNELILTIESADVLGDAAVLLPIAGDDLVEPDEFLTLELAAALAGSDTLSEMPIDSDQQRHRVTITDTNLAPEVSITATQGDEAGSAFISDAGEVTMSAVVTDVNGGDNHSYQWYTSELPVTPGDQASFTFDPQSMALGDYSVSVVVTDDGNPMLSSEEATFMFTLEASEVPGDGDTGGETPVNPGTNKSGGSSGGSAGFWLLCLLMLGGLWRRRLAAC
ncbi:hypothetical protein [Microbulbifer sp. ALW1]|uniref:hypothetical protein n=1 Tax=Microbulbifer sp. (strain ALW1) TaxID=1516059 RepID=UPI001359B431|nr:hypothetical protein [Microbulbifer sp. ALW1]